MPFLSSPFAPPLIQACQARARTRTSTSSAIFSGRSICAQRRIATSATGGVYPLRACPRFRAGRAWRSRGRPTRVAGSTPVSLAARPCQRTVRRSRSEPPVRGPRSLEGFRRPAVHRDVASLSMKGRDSSGSYSARGVASSTREVQAKTPSPSPAAPARTDPIRVIPESPWKRMSPSRGTCHDNVSGTLKGTTGGQAEAAASGQAPVDDLGGLIRGNP